MFNNIYQGKKVLITGDTGFKGSWLAIWLNMLGADVYGYALPPLREEDNYNVTGLNKNITHQDGDVRDYDKLLGFLQKVQPDIVFHLAAQALVLPSYRQPRETYEVNLMGTVNFFEAVRHSESVKVAVNVTSDKCYHNNEWVWGYRETDPMGGKDPYSSSKGCSELISQAYNHSFFNNSRCGIATARAGNVIGAGDWADYRIVPDYFRALKRKESLEIRNPHATRPWQHVLEPLSGYLLLASALYYDKEKFDGGWNFGPKDNMNYSVARLIETIQKYENKGVYKTSELKEKPHEAHLLKLDISKAVKYLEWQPVFDFEQTVEVTAKGYMNDLSGYSALNDREKTIKAYIAEAQRQNISWTMDKI